MQRYEQGGLDALEPRSRRPRSNPASTPEAVRTRIIELREKLTIDGLDAGPATIAWHLHTENINPPAASTIRRVLLDAGLVRPEPRKRPRTSLRRFAAEQPNETWQSDFTYWHLADGTDAQILNWLDDHSRYLLAATAHTKVTGTDVTHTFITTINTYGPPASTLTDNGLVYTTRLLKDRSARNGFEHLLTTLGITQKNGAPSHPQTQGKIERFHQTLKKWLAGQPPATTLARLQTQLDTFRQIYNEQRPHRALDRRTPVQAYTALPKARPTGTPTARATTGSGSTTSGPTARSPCAAQARCTTSASEQPTTARPSSSSSPTPRSPSSTAPPDRPWPPTPSTQPATTGATTNESPADGRALRYKR